MKKFLFLSFVGFAAAIAQAPDDSVLVSTESKTVVETVSKEWRTIMFIADPGTGEIRVVAAYESVTRVDGVPKERIPIREVSIPWANATNIAPALAIVREQFKAAMPTILTNTP